MTTLSDDPRWRRFNDSSRPCPCCGRIFQGVFDIGYDHPDPWPHGNRADLDVDRLEDGSDYLTADLCEWQGYRFIRAVLPIKIKGSDQVFSYGPWASVNPENFDRYTAAMLSGDPEAFQGCFAWLSNMLPGHDMNEQLPCDLLPGGPNERPSLWVHDGSHPLAAMQEDGITFDELLDLYSAAGQDIRPHLMDG